MVENESEVLDGSGPRYIATVCREKTVWSLAYLKEPSVLIERRSGYVTSAQGI